MTDKVKITLYLDIMDGLPITGASYINATNQPGKKYEGCTRYSFDVWVDNPLEADEKITVENARKVDVEPE